MTAFTTTYGDVYAPDSTNVVVQPFTAGGQQGMLVHVLEVVEYGSHLPLLTTVNILTGTVTRP